MRLSLSSTIGAAAEYYAHRDRLNQLETAMLKIAALIWAFLGPTLAGILILVVICVPSLLNQGMRLIPYAGILGLVLGIPLAILIARKIEHRVPSGA